MCLLRRLHPLLSSLVEAVSAPSPWPSGPGGGVLVLSSLLQLPDPPPPAVWQKPGATASFPCSPLNAIFYHHSQNPHLPSSRVTWMSTQVTRLIRCPHTSLTFSSPLTFSCKLPFSPTPSVPSWTYPHQKWFGPWNQASFLHRGLTPPTPSSCFTLQCGNPFSGDPFKDTIQPPHP